VETRSAERANHVQPKISRTCNCANRIPIRKHQIGEILGQERDLRAGSKLVRIEVPTPAYHHVSDSLKSLRDPK